MNIDRRSVLAMGLGMLLPVPALASPAAEMDTLLSEAPWVGDGEPSRRHVYVVFAPWCPTCKLLFQRTRSARGGVQLRWVAGGSRDERAINQNLSIVSKRSLDALAGVFRQEPVEDMTKDVQAVLRLTLSEMQIKEMAKRIKFIGYPTLIFADSRGELQSIAGVPADLDAVFAQVGPWGKA